MNSKNLGVIFGPCLLRQRPTNLPITNSVLAEYVNKARLVEFLITHSQKIFDGSLQPQDVTCSTGAVLQVNENSPSNPVLSPEERNSEQSRKSLSYSSEEVSFDHCRIALELDDVYVNKLIVFELFMLRCVLLF
ncbi:rho GTPase-activating protein 29-like protein [Leptotrombidium deliense]|uniref:Rho GTPase-activating protein 29-like protein n=1 Tax=Leptotrombidium deliense TaxID=299467 RepID=A0A443S072_9ACAR|nr:rho GTPase-activating protein 29-like protein [Leptotrombidium deliense]